MWFVGRLCFGEVGYRWVSIVCCGDGELVFSWRVIWDGAHLYGCSKAWFWVDIFDDFIASYF